MCATCLTHLILLDLTTLLTFAQAYEVLIMQPNFTPIQNSR